MTTLGPDGIEYPNIIIETFNALRDRDYDRFEDLYNNGLDINARGPYNNTFLLPQMHALDVMNTYILLHMGIDPNATDVNGSTPLDYVYLLPTLRVYSDDELQRSRNIENMLRDFGGYRSRELRMRRNSDSSDPNSIPSDPDYELMRNQAATEIQRRMRGRQQRQTRNLTRRNIGMQSLNPTRRERFRRFTEHNRMLDKNDQLSGYLHDVYFPSKVKGKSSSKSKVAKRTKKKRNKRNRY